MLVLHQCKIRCGTFWHRIIHNMRWGIFEWLVIIIVLIFMGGYALFVFPPSSFPTNTTVVIPQGEAVRGIATTLSDKRLIISPTLFRILVRVTGGQGSVQAGVYRFNKPIGLFAITNRLLNGQLGVVPIRITFSEGMTTREIGDTLTTRFPNITADGFSKKARQYEGYLFPDTYTFLPNVTTKTVITTMRKNFNIRIASITPQINMSGHSLKSLVIMASLLEREARTLKERRIVAGILWHRISIGMPLQVDAVFGYIFKKQTFSPSLADLKVDSPYNTYTHRGLPPGPISNPGLISLLAAATPIKTAYLYYLTGTNGQMHYAATLAEHNANSVMYLHR